MAAEGPRAVLFDIDGTLIKSGGASDRSWQHAFRELHGVEVDIRKTTGRGLPDPEVGRQAFRAALGRDATPEEMARLMERRLRHLPQEVERAEGYRVLDGAEDLLERLIDEGFLLGLTTGNVEAAAHIKLARGGLNRFFSFGGYGSDSPDRTALTRLAVQRAATVAGTAIEPAAMRSVGDTPRDVEAGHGAGIRVVGVATGDFDVGQLTDAGAEWAIASLRDFPPQ